ncbi:MAG: BMC domain-containing protein [Ignavibacteriales bacterium]|nr:BMC domain-containing protein [Ignavibacteriales bacterium]
MIESKGIVALIEAADVILKNSPVTILGIHKLDNGLVSLAVSGNSDYVRAAIESGVEAGRRVGEIYASSVVDNPGKDLLEIFSELFPGDEIFKSVQDEVNKEKVKFAEKIPKRILIFLNLLFSNLKQNPKEKNQNHYRLPGLLPSIKSKNLKIKQIINSNSKLDETIENKIEDDKKLSKKMI